ncbi:MAG: hypothetical protein JWN99_3009 [Ilumatobacteraceae bacterium]|nr:hypothetical protein [Ilumatobacteraceae bacterium]
MRRTWPLLLTLGSIGAIAGTAIAGGNEAESDAVVVLTPTSVFTTPTGLDGLPIVTVTLAPAATLDVPVEPAAPSVSLDIPTTTTTIPVDTTTTVIAASEAPVPTDAAVVDTAAPVAVTKTSPPPAAEVPATDDIPTTDQTPASTVVVDPTEKTTLRVVVANANGQRTAPRVGYQLFSEGYETVTVGTATGLLDLTTIYYRDGFDADAAVVAQDMGMPTAVLSPIPANPATPFTDSDDQGDVIVLLGADSTA